MLYLKKIKSSIKKLRKTLVYIAQAILVYFFFGLFSLLPLDFASWLGGTIAKTVYKMLPKTQIAKKNLRLVFPEKSEKEINLIVKNMWNNLGRTIAEYCHLKEFINNNQKRIKIKGVENLQQIINMNKGGIIISAHFGNWEMAVPIAENFGIKMNSVYRKPNNKLLKPLFNLRVKSLKYCKMIEKNKDTTNTILKVLSNKEYIGMLIDQKITNGIKINFLGQDTVMSTSNSLFAIKTEAPILMTMLRRVKGANFEATIYPPIMPDKSNNKDDEQLKILCYSTQVIEKWIKKYPEQWLWIHDRWRTKKK